LKKAFVFVLALSVAGAVLAQDTLWVRLLDTGGADAGATAVACLGSDVYVAGQTFGSPGALRFAKYSPSGSLVWNKSCGLDSTVCRGLAVGSDQGPYVLAATTRRPPTELLLKLSSSGDTLWTRNFPGSRAAGLSCDAAGRALVAGTTSSADSVWVARYAAGGGRDWRQSYRFTQSHEVLGLDTVPGGLLAAVGLTDSMTRMMLVKFGPAGETLWTGVLDAGVFTRVLALAAARPQGSYLLAQGPGGALLARLDADGDTLWTRPLTVGTPVYDLATDTAGNVFVGYSVGDFLLEKYSPAGALARSVSGGTADNDIAQALACGDDAAPVVAGASSDTLRHSRLLTVKLQGQAAAVAEPVPPRRIPACRMLGTVAAGAAVAFELPAPGDYRFMVCDNSGRILSSAQVRSTGGRFVLPLAGPGAGVRFVRVFGPAADETAKLVVLR